MTDQEIADLGPAFANYLRSYRDCFLQKRTSQHFDTYCRGLLADLPRKTVEPIALASGTAVRTLQEFLVTANWDHLRARDRLQQQVAAVLKELPADPLGTIGVIDETSCLKKGDQTPGVQRQYLGCVGKIDNGIVTVHVGVAHGRFQALLDADLYLPKVWDQDRDRCAAAGIPAEVHYRAKWRIALEQLLRLHGNGVRFDWLTFDEGYGSKVPFLKILDLVGQKFVAEVPVSFKVRRNQGGVAERADQVRSAQAARHGKRYRVQRPTTRDQFWRASRELVWVSGRCWRLVVAVNEATGEVKYFVSNAVHETVERLLKVAFRRATIEHTFRVGKQEAGLMHFEGRSYQGLLRHLILSLIVLGFVSRHTERLRGEKSAGDGGTSVSGIERPLCAAISSPPGNGGGGTRGSGDPVSPAAQRASHTLPQEAAA
jgi:SRSO17 transposase